MVKLVVTFNLAEGSDPDAFEDELHRTYLSRAYRLPTLRKVEVAKALTHLRGNADYERIMELYFDTLSDVHHALESAAGQTFAQAFSAATVAGVKWTICRVE